jgi:hypothetical protein
MHATVPMQHYGWVTQEVLEVRPRSGHRSPRRPAFWWTIGIAYLTVFSLVAFTAGALFAAQTVQAERLFTAVEASERSMGVVQAEVSEVFRQFESEDLTETDRRELVAQLEDIAARGEVSIAAAGERVADVRIWPMNTRLEQARSAYMRHNQAWVDYMARASEDPGQFVSPQPEVNASFFDARIPLLRAIPRIDVLDLKRRLDVIYADSDEEGGSGGGTQA